MKTLIKRLLLPGYDLEKERAIQEAIVALRRLDAENKSLRVKIEQMERQEPVGTTGGMPGTTGFTMACFHADKVPIGFKLYALPGAQAQNAPSIPEGWKLVPIEPTEEMYNAGANHCDGYWSTAQAVWDAMLAAAPEDKP